MKRPIPSDPPHSKGFTLVEVVVSLTLMAIVFTAAFGSYYLGIRLLEDARHRLRASQIIQSEVERLRTLNWSALQALDASATFIPSGEYVAQFANLYTTERSVEFFSAGNQAEITIEVDWTNSKGIQSSESFSTVFTKGGLSDYLYSIPPGTQ